MNVRLRVEFLIKSNNIPPTEITTLVGILPSSSVVKESHIRGGQPRPVSHIWRLVLDSTGPVEEQLAELVALVRPSTERIASIIDDDTRCYVRICRNFTPGPSNQAIGFGIGQEILRFLVNVGAELDIDDYDDMDSGRTQENEEPI